VVEAGTGTDLLPTCNPDDPSTSILPSSGDSDTPHQPLFRSILQVSCTSSFFLSCCLYFA
jgi:hypothetical protein